MKTKAKKGKVKKIIIPHKYFTAVKEGIKFLDLAVGRKRWLSKMDMTQFEITDPGTCVAGNVFRDAMFGGNDDGYGKFLNLIDELGGYGSDTAIRFGFNSKSDKGMQYLQDIWVRAINRMKKQARIK